jgi:deazaflavin-dependent oxidoreductase (nitroreductase family)
VKRQVTLIATGRRSGTPRAVTLYAFDDGENLVIVGSRGGSAKDPVWAENLRDNPLAAVRIGKEVREFRAREVEGSERERLWQLAIKEFPMYSYYESKTKRLIPLFSLEPIGAD